MNRFFSVTAVSIFSLFMNTHAQHLGEITPEIIAQLRQSYQPTDQDLATHNAVTNTPINQLALNRQILRGEDGLFSHKIKNASITNQKSSGRCWMFAGLNVMRPRLIAEKQLPEFEFSTAFLLFWDKIEKSNLYLENVIELRHSDRLDREWLLINDNPIGDGGWWNYVTGLIQKYGVVPATVMPETQSSEDTNTLNLILERLLRKEATQILEASKNNLPEADLRKLKEEALQKVYRFLVLNLGQPPTEFSYRFEIKEKKENQPDENAPENNSPENANLTPLQTYTPQSFYRDFVNIDLQEYLCLYHDPSQPLNQHYRFQRATNIAGQPEMNFANIPIEEMKQIAIKSILANQPMWFAVNMGFDQSSEHGLMQVDLFDYETLFGLDLTLTKAQRSHFAAGASNHAMTLIGVDLLEGKPTKWLVENSWGDQKGRQGKWTLYDDWFTEHVYTIIVPRQHLPEKVLEIFNQPSTALPAWYPGASGIQPQKQ